MKTTRYIILAVMVFVLVFSAACAAQPEAEVQETDMAEEDMAEDEAMEEDTMAAEESVQLELTLDELAEFDGKDGKPAYVAVDGIIYDMSDSLLWKNGEHNGYSAGQDLTDIIKNESPHGVKNLERVPAIGILVE